ncbi:hypothetical protein [Longimicrobium terrae]|uniref:DUF3131 domain-containing protein n=1 Tax=Longimicrobium terrae TaxID=1639882 RepID=A0A841H6Z5_9BACT|nr:hypothetical protein [Longimicrobium terrae]MBB4639529.1 hypothetical protein [Longimicrobium terrae]MBB6073900.1 hypothetical protein [Longimicrobium terrae]NNC32482.1 hypothetical protein [Longimicrobium terrae]
MRRIEVAFVMLGLCALCAAAGCASAGRAAAPPPAERTMQGIIDDRVVPHLEHYFERIAAERGALAIDGVPAFSESDHFVGGKVISSMAYVLERTPRGTPEFARRVEMMRGIVDFVSRQPGYATWNHLYAIKGLHRLERAGLLDDVAPDSILNRLRTQLDWRGFVDPTDLHLINLPTNYYGVAFGIARYRELLGWDRPGDSERILAKLLTHVREYSAEGYMDETPGDGRFDRYTVLIPSELAILLTATETPVPPMIRDMLRRSSEIALQLANPRGDGFPYGRSIGLYGDLATVQVLSIAARLGVLTPEESAAAYAYNTRMVQKYADFWIDPAMRSVNMWDHGRRTDEYRNKGRILGENLSTAMQIVEAEEDWEAAGFTGAPSAAALDRFLAGLPRYRLFRFSTGEYERALLIARNGGRVIALPLISGARGYYASTPYLPAPAAVGSLETPPNTQLPHLVPRWTLADGGARMPVVYMRAIRTEERGDTLYLRVSQDALARVGDAAPRADSSMSVNTTFVFAPGSMERRDVFRAARPVTARALEMEFVTASSGGTARGGRVEFAAGPVASIEAWGAGEPVVEALSGPQALGGPNGPLRSHVRWNRANPTLGGSAEVRWRMTWR